MMTQPSILVVDDELLIRDLLYDFFSGQGWRIAVAENGEKALAVLQDKEIDLVLSDIKMPEMDGLQLAETLKERHPDLNIFITDQGWDESLRQNLQNAILMGRPPDVVIGENYFRQFAEAGDLQPLDELLAEYADEWRLRQIVKRHSDFVAFPIYVGEPEEDQEPISETPAEIDEAAGQSEGEEEE